MAITILASAFVGWKFLRTEAPTPDRPQPVNIAASSPSMPVSAASIAVQSSNTPTADQPASAEPSSKAALVDYLTKFGGPKEKFRAYQIVRKCLDARDDQALVAIRATNDNPKPVPDPNQACGDITSAQVAARMRLLEQAVNAGVHGAARAFGLEGPGGYGLEMERPIDDPEAVAYREASAKAVDIGGAHGDEWSLMTLSMRYEFPDGDIPADNPKALTYLVAANDQYKAQNGNDRKSYEKEVNRLKSKLTPSQAEAAISAGHQLFSTFNSQQ